MKEMIEICDALLNLRDQPCALATVIHVEGSAYRRPGARMLLTADGQTRGMISGGCLEHDIFDCARRVLRAGCPRTVRYDSTSADDIIFGTGLGCNGIIEVFVEPITDRFRVSFISAMEDCQETRQTGGLATVVSGDNPFPGRHSFLIQERWTGDMELNRLLQGRPVEKEPFLFSEAGSNVRVFVQPLLPPVQLVIFGGWLDVVPLIRFGRETGFQVVVVDSRRRQSSRDAFREAHSVLLCSPGEALQQIQFDARTVAVLMNHNFECDQEALAALAHVSLPFVGMLGPRRRQQSLLEALRNDGVVMTDEFERALHGPVGLDIGAKTPEEIALSIMAEILSVLNERNAKPIRERSAPLHVSPPLLAYA